MTGKLVVEGVNGETLNVDNSSRCISQRRMSTTEADELAQSVPGWYAYMSEWELQTSYHIISTSLYVFHFGTHIRVCFMTTYHS